MCHLTLLAALIVFIIVIVIITLLEEGMTLDVLNPLPLPLDYGILKTRV